MYLVVARHTMSVLSSILNIRQAALTCLGGSLYTYARRDEPYSPELGVMKEPYPTVFYLCAAYTVHMYLINYRGHSLRVCPGVVAKALVLGMVVYVFVVRFERHCAKGHKKIMDGVWGRNLKEIGMSDGQNSLDAALLLRPPM